MFYRNIAEPHNRSAIGTLTSLGGESMREHRFCPRQKGWFDAHVGDAQKREYTTRVPEAIARNAKNYGVLLPERFNSWLKLFEVDEWQSMKQLASGLSANDDCHRDGNAQNQKV